ncbi:hypothetical protein [Blautia wexlerae]|uniref:hypothetical protein n=1 Tax=Blautia wexlerae TaxID=418240 RepID=UPI00156E157D|nr:hypothetical protein [Blautia wexlerae]NSF39988.1 hypothetical protein [Blautia wexlerae]
MTSTELLKQLLSIVGTSKFTEDSRFYSKKGSNVPDLKIGSTYFYNRLRQPTPIIDRVKNLLKQIYTCILSNETDISDLATSEKLDSFFKEYIKIDTSCFVFWGDDSESLRKEKINSWLELLDILLDEAINKAEIFFTARDFKEKLEQQQKAVERLCAGTHTEVILAEQAETGAFDDHMKEFFCGNYYCYYAASDSENTIRGGKLNIYTDGKALKAKLILRISDDSLLNDTQLDRILEMESTKAYQALNSHKAHEISNQRYSVGRCEIYTGTFKIYKTHIRIDLQHPERGYSGFILLHKIDSSTQKNLQGCLAYLMNIPDSNSIYMRKIGISTFCFSLKNKDLWKFIGLQNDIPFMEVSKSHKDNNHLFYTYVWDNIIQNAKDAKNNESQPESSKQTDVGLADAPATIMN